MVCALRHVAMTNDSNKYLSILSLTSSHLFWFQTTMPTSLDQLKSTGTVVVSDSGDFECEYAEVSQF